MAEAFRKAKEGFAQMVQDGADAIGLEVWDELPNLEILAAVQNLEVKLEAVEEIQEAISAYMVNNYTDFSPIKFNIIKEKGDKEVVLIAVLKPVTGFTVFAPDQEDDPIMNVNLPFEDAESMGKLQHPSGAAIYEIHEAKSRRGRIKYVIQKAVGDKDYLFLRKERNMRLKMAKVTGMTFDDQIYRVTEGRKTVATIQPKTSIASTINSYSIHFMTNCKDLQARGIAVGVALLLTLNVAYHELRNLLKESVKSADE